MPRVSQRSMGMPPRAQEPQYWDDMLVPQSQHIVHSRTWWEISKSPPELKEGGVGATVMPDGTFVPDNVGDPRSPQLRRNYFDLCGEERSMPLTAVNAFSRAKEGAASQSAMESERYAFPLPEDAFWRANLVSTGAIAGDLNDKALQNISSLCTESHAVVPSRLNEFLRSQEGFTCLLLNEMTLREITGLNMHPNDWSSKSWSVHPCLRSPTRGFAMRGQQDKALRRDGLAAFVDWTVPENTMYLVDGRGLLLHVGPRRVYYQDERLVIVDYHKLEVSKGTHGMKVVVNAQCELLQEP